MTQLMAAIAWAQVPLPAQASVVQASPSSQDATPQQMPLTQFPLAQVNPLVQAVPLGRFWQVPLTHLFPPFGSVEPGSSALQSALLEEQLVLQVALPASH